MFSKLGLNSKAHLTTFNKDSRSKQGMAPMETEMRADDVTQLAECLSEKHELQFSA